MRKLYFLIIISFLLTSCNSDNYKFSNLQRNIIEFVNDDGKISQEEYNQLIDGIISSEDPKIERFKSGIDEVNYSTLNDYILKYAKTKNITLTENDIWQANSPQVESKDFNINVFVENSASMDGYLNDPSTQFRNSVYSLLTRLKLLIENDSLNLYFINKESQLQFRNASNNDVERFKNILNPKDFKNISLGNRGETDMKDLMQKILNYVDDSHLSVFIIDGVFSPGNKYNKKDSAILHQYLTEQKIGITSVFERKLIQQKSDLSAIVLQMKAGFQGIYYFPDDTRINFTEKIDRPYYIWFIGTKSQIEEVLNSKKLDEIDGGYLNKWILKVPTNTQPDFKIQYSPKIGTFDARDLAKGIIQKAKISKNNQNKGKFGFSVAVDFSKFLKDEMYFLDENNYKISNVDYHLTTQRIEDKNNPALKGYTHILKLETDNLKDEELKIELLERIPNWINNSSSINDSKILTDENEQTKTFGLQYLMEGVGDAFYPSTKENIIGSFKITIKK